MNDDKTRQILDATHYATISTVDKEGSPWAAPVWYTLDDSNNIYWWSAKTSQHSMNIKSDPKCYITIFDSTLPEGKGVGLYIRAEAFEINDDSEIDSAIDLYNNTTEVFKLKIGDCTGKAPTRIYKAIPRKVWINSEAEVDGQYVDTRKMLA